MTVAAHFAILSHYVLDPGQHKGKLRRGEEPHHGTIYFAQKGGQFVLGVAAVAVDNRSAVTSTPSGDTPGLEMLLVVRVGIPVRQRVRKSRIFKLSDPVAVSQNRP